MPGSKISHGPENNSFAAFFNAFEVKEKTEGRLHRGGRRQSGDWIIGKVMRFCAFFFKGGYSFEGYSDILEVC